MAEKRAKKAAAAGGCFFVNSLHAFGNGDGHGDGCADHGVIAHADEAHHLHAFGNGDGHGDGCADHGVIAHADEAHHIIST